ncbi:nitrilase-related carbon-nitrogen hydrolase [Paracoccus sanguinis]|uniref:nitrilase-related carbon-nitrogen hydrolase n=1 Tax=Paracoccus sanguinis TaxID=1545044 RepID=UPI00051DF13C|nr:nitrilase-related carbon-nitrogen hydrolase [Paracoccus sanguinis]KGJ13961.1 amidohydrolase [Paracoccus sanguinis]
MRAGLVQLSVGDDPAANLPVTLDFIRQAASGGAQFVLTPEVTNLLTPDRARQARLLHREADDPTLAALSAEAERLGVWLLIGSLSLLSDAADEPRFANRSLLIAPNGGIVARYDKIHMFDVTVSATESYCESAAFRPGDRAVLASGPVVGGAPVGVGMTVCYDLRFPHLYRRLARAGAQILTVPAAFNDTTGAAHWEVLLRARAIETGCFVLAPGRDGGTAPGVTLVDLDLARVEDARRRVPAWRHDPVIWGP